MPQSTTDRNLLFGILALQMDFIRRDALIAAMHAWVLEKAKPLGQILLEHKALTADTHALLEALVQKHLALHGNDAEKSLAAVSSVGSVRNDLQQIADPDVQASLVHVAADPFATVAPPSVGTPTSGGLRFRVLRPHAKGGLGEVFVAQDEELHREVALKEIQNRHADNQESRSRFLLEAEITGGLEHPGIVPVYGLGTYADGRPYYAMRFIRGDSLQDAIKRYHQGEPGAPATGERVLELRKLLGRFIDVCQAIQYAHDRGVLHRDLKPGNIMLGKYGETLVVDWGLAKALGEPGTPTSGAPTSATIANEPALHPRSSTGSSETQAGSAVGTPQYMSPEQAAGRLDLLGPASDVYSLGATLYYLLVSKVPFPDNDVGAVLGKVQRGDFPAPRKIKPEISRALEAICLKAMSQKGQDRYNSVRALGDDIEHWLADEPVSACRESLSSRLARWARRHKGLVRSGVVAGLAILATVTVALVLITQSRDEALRSKDAAEEQQRKAQVAQQLAEAAHQDALKANQKTELALHATRTSLYANSIGQAERAWAGGNFPLARETLDSALPEHRNWEWHYLRRLQGDLLTFKPEGEYNFVGVAFSPDNKRIVASHGSKVVLLDPATGKEVLGTERATEAVFGVAFSPDGTRVASAGWDMTVRVWDATTLKPIWVLEKHTDKVYDVAFSPNGRQLASASSDRTVIVWDLVAGKEAFTLAGHPGFVEAVGWSPDGKLIASAGFQALKIWDAVTGEEKMSLTGHTAPVFGVAFSPDSSQLVSGARDNTVRLWDTTSGAEIRVFRGHANVVAAVKFSSDGKRIASASYDRSVRIWDPSNGATLLVLRGHNNAVTTLAFSGDGRRLVTGSWDHTAKIWDTSQNLHQLSLSGQKGSISGVAFSPDGRQLASSSTDRTVRVWDVASGKVLHSLASGHEAALTSVAFCPDGKHLACGDARGMIEVWDISSGERVFTLTGHARAVNSIAYSPDGKLLASTSNDMTAKLWDCTAGRLVRTFEGHTSAVYGLAFCPEGRHLVTGSNDFTARIWDVATGRSVHTFEGHSNSVNSVAYSRDGQRIATGGADATVKVWDAKNWQAVFSLPQGTDRVVWSLAFSRDGTRLAAGLDDGKVKFWEMSAGEYLLTIAAHKGFVWGLAFSPDGNRLASGGEDQFVRIWNGASLQTMTTEP